MRLTAKDISLGAIFTALTAISAFIKIPIPYVPLTMQPLIVMLAGTILGSRLGALSQILYVAIGLVGFPIFAYGGGPAYVLQPTFGYLIGFILGAYIIGKLLEFKHNPGIFWRAFSIIGGLVGVYAIGASYLFFNLNFIQGKAISFAKVIKIGFLIPIPGDLIKAIIAIAITPSLKRVIKIS